MSATTCACCWFCKKRCEPARDRCKRCSRTPRSIRECPSFPYADIEDKFRDSGWQKYLHSLDTQDPDFSKLYLDILVWSPQKEASQKPPSRKFTTQEDSGQKDCPGKIEKTLHINGLFATNNELLIRSLDEIGREFSVGLKDKVGESRLISLASLAGGYLSMACSFSRKDIHEQVRTYLDDSAIDNEFSDYKVYLHFRYLLVCRFSELAEQILAAIRQADPDTMDRSTCWNRYAAAVILHCEVHHFKDSLKNGLLSKSVHPELEGPFLKWLGSAEQELNDHMIKGCRRFQSWHAVVEGPLKPLHDKRGQETLMITMHLQRNKFRPQNAPFWPSPHPQAIDSYRIDVSYPMTQSISHSSSSTLQNQSANNYPDTISQPTGSSPSRTTELSPFEQTRPLSEYDFLWPMTDQPGALIYGSGGMGQLSYPQDPFPPFLSDGREEIGSQEDSNFHLETCLSFENMGNVSTYDPRFDFNITNQKLYYEALN